MVSDHAAPLLIHPLQVLPAVPACRCPSIGRSSACSSIVARCQNDKHLDQKVSVCEKQMRCGPSSAFKWSFCTGSVPVRPSSAASGCASAALQKVATPA